jgi:hypothetical protein
VLAQPEGDPGYYGHNGISSWFADVDEMYEYVTFHVYFDELLGLHELRRRPARRGGGSRLRSGGDVALKIGGLSAVALRTRSDYPLCMERSAFESTLASRAKRQWAESRGPLFLLVQLELGVARLGPSLDHRLDPLVLHRYLQLSQYERRRRSNAFGFLA